MNPDRFDSGSSGQVLSADPVQFRNILFGQERVGVESLEDPRYRVGIGRSTQTGHDDGQVSGDAAGTRRNHVGSSIIEAP
jgi:hypothetical protein